MLRDDVERRVEDVAVVEWRARGDTAQASASSTPMLSSRRTDAERDRRQQPHRTSEFIQRRHRRTVDDREVLDRRDVADGVGEHLLQLGGGRGARLCGVTARAQRAVEHRGDRAAAPR